jgi:general L-amino acid transport system substrate-binding protein
LLLGFDVDFCRAIAAAIFDGDGTKVNFTDLPTSERFHSLHNGEIDLLARLVTVTLSRDVLEPSTQVGFSFTQPTFFDGLSFGGIPP